MKKVFIVFSILLLIYMIWPGPSDISNFKALPNSSKSTLYGDTTELPNISAYFSDNFREDVVPLYYSNYWWETKLPFPPLRINHAPEYSWVAIKKHTDSTYLEEFVYPLRDSLYVNGFEPFYSDKTPKFWGSAMMTEGGKAYFTKTTLRYYPSSILTRIVVWLGICLSFFWMYKLGKRIIFK